ncbi:MFS transporter [Hyphobacterium sp.]|uniref:MFS transporter n=1 Tax=Hyphobacterium sp. TaxID=2004662 RepID=UPI003BAC0447
MAQPLRPPCESARLAELGSGECPKAHRPFVLAAAILGSSMVFIDSSALSVAIPALRNDLDASPSDLNWIFNAYTLLLAAFTLIGGAAADRSGPKRIFLWGGAGFALASLACGLANTAETLIAARAVQGFFGALLTPASLAMIAAAYPEEERAAAIGTWAGASALTTAGGPVLGGWLVETLSWHWIFFINLPVGALALGAALTANLKHIRPTTKQSMDLPGAIMIALSLALMAFGLVALGEGGASRMEAGISLIASLIMLAGFVLRERSADAPMLPLSIFKSRAFSGINLATLVLYAALSTAFFGLPIFLADVRGWSATQIGLAFLPFTLSVGFLSGLFGKYSKTYGVRLTMVAGCGLVIVAFIMLAAFGGLPGWWPIYLPMLLAGLGFALIIPPLTATALSSAPQAFSGRASGVNNAASRVASMLGVALAAALLAAQVDWIWMFASAAVLTALAALIILASIRSTSANDAPGTF